MKNTIRARRNNGNNRTSAQSKKPSIPGQNTATIGHFESETVRSLIGRAIGLSEKEISAIFLLADWKRLTVSEFCKASILGGAQAAYDDIHEVAKTELPAVSATAILLEDKTRAERFLYALEPLISPAGGDPVALIAPDQREKEPSLSKNKSTDPVQSCGDLAEDAKAALRDLDMAGAAAVSLLILSASRLCEMAKCAQPQASPLREFTFVHSPKFGPGVAELALNKADTFKRAMDDYRAEQISIIEQRPMHRSIGSIECEIYSIAILLEFIGEAFDSYDGSKGCGAGLLSQEASARLRSAWENSFSYFKKFRDRQNSITEANLAA